MALPPLRVIFRFSALIRVAQSSALRRITAMTARADLLTKRAKDRDRGAAPEPSIPAQVLGVYMEAMHHLGYEVDAQCAQAGITRTSLEAIRMPRSRARSGFRFFGVRCSHAR